MVIQLLMGANGEEQGILMGVASHDCYRTRRGAAPFLYSNPQLFTGRVRDEENFYGKEQITTRRMERGKD